jgi:hypothetical protein
MGARIYRLCGGRHGFGELAAVAVIAFWPEALPMAKQALSENLTVLLLTAWVLMGAYLLTGRSQASRIPWFVFGLLAGLLFYTRSEFLPVIVLGFVITLLPYSRKAILANLAPMVIMSLPFILLPVARNAIDFGEFIPLTTAGGRTLWLATIHSDSFYFSSKNAPVLRAAYVAGKPGATERNFQGIAIESIRSNPLYYLDGVCARFVEVNFDAFGRPPVRAPDGRNLLLRAIIFRLSKLLLVLGMLSGFYVICWSQRTLLGMFLFGIYVFKFVILHTLFNGVPRMFYPFYPIAVAVAILGWEHAYASALRIKRAYAVTRIKATATQPPGLRLTVFTCLAALGSCFLQLAALIDRRFRLLKGLSRWHRKHFIREQLASRMFSFMRSLDKSVLSENLRSITCSSPGRHGIALFSPLQMQLWSRKTPQEEYNSSVSAQKKEIPA